MSAQTVPIVMKEAYEALEIFNYFKAKNAFLDNATRFPVLSSYGLATIYSRGDNPFYDLDSAYYHYKRAYIYYNKATQIEKNIVQTTLRPFPRLGVSVDGLKEKQDTTLKQIYEQTLESGDIAALDRFVNTYYQSEYAIKLRGTLSQLAYRDAQRTHTALSYREFLVYYPESPYVDSALHWYEKLIFEEKVQEGTAQSFYDFILLYPESPYISEAQKRIYEVLTRDQKTESYLYFVDQFPNHPYAERAWRVIYRRSLMKYTLAEVDSFEIKYPFFPFKKWLKEERSFMQEKYYRIQKGGKYGYVDRSGEIKIKPMYDFAADFSNGLAMVSSIEEPDRVMYIDKRNSMIIPPMYSEGEGFRDGYAIVDSNFMYGVIDRQNRKILPCVYKKISYVNERFFLVQTDSSYAIKSTDGKDVLGEPIDELQQFVEDHAIVRKYDKYGLINIQGDFVFGFDYEALLPLGPKNTFVAKKNGVYGIITSWGDEVVPFKYKHLGPLLNKRILFSTDDKRYGYLDSLGQVVIKPVFRVYKGYEDKANFTHKMATTMSKGKVGLINTRGKRVVPNIFRDILPHDDFPIIAKKNNKWGIIDRNVRIRSLAYDDILLTRGEYAVARKKKFVGVIKIVRRKKRYELAPTSTFDYTSIKPLADSYWIAKKPTNLSGILDKNAKVIVPFDYTFIEPVGEGRVRLTRSGEIHYFDLNTQQFIYKP